MSLNNAINYRQDLIASYTKMLDSETSQFRIDEIKSQIELCKKEIEQLKDQQFKIFGKKEPLKPITTVFEPNLEKPGTQKVTVLNGPVVVLADTPSQAPELVQPSHSGKRLENNLRAKIQAAKAARKA